MTVFCRPYLGNVDPFLVASGGREDSLLKLLHRKAITGCKQGSFGVPMTGDVERHATEALSCPRVDGAAEQ